MTAIQEYTGAQVDELSFSAGAEIAVTNNDGAWWEGHLVSAPSVVGVFPSNFVQPAADGDSSDGGVVSPHAGQVVVAIADYASDQPGDLVCTGAPSSARGSPVWD